jgi:hypothetical protein
MDAIYHELLTTNEQYLCLYIFGRLVLDLV